MGDEKYRIEDYVRLEDILDDFPLLSRRMVQRWCNSGKYPHAVKVGKCWCLHREQFKNWLAAGGLAAGE